MTSTTNHIRLQSDLKEHVKGVYKFQNARNGTRIITKEMADYTAVNPTWRKIISSINLIISHLPPDMPAEDISSSLEDLGFCIFNVRQMTVTQEAPSGQTHVETLPLFLVILTRNIKS
jgi:hypothetical protein